jgi:small subunit ribosomal protein S6
MYEGMFLVDSARAGSDWDGIIAAITKILERAQAEIVSIRKWEDRRLAYEIKHVGRGTYILVYFRADGQNIQGIEKAVQLSEQILRVLILSAEHMTAEDMEKDTPATKVEREETEPAPVVETVEEDQAEAPDDLQEVPVIEEEPQDIEEAETVEETGIKEDAGIAEETGQAGDVEPADEEEESKPKTWLDD